MLLNNAHNKRGKMEPNLIEQLDITMLNYSKLIKIAFILSKPPPSQIYNNSACSAVSSSACSATQAEN